MEYGIISNECAIRLKNSGYLLYAQSRDYLDEVTLMIISDYVGKSLSVEGLIELVIAEGRTFLKKSDEINP
ncbi:MAG TPA: hypothetical protein VLN47_01545 [Clostridiaceae bacterium]|nr:hypothetical protein [Clostridiaceae bacterium]